MPVFTLTVAASEDGFISRNTDEPPQAWASDEEQALFFRDVEAADWAIMGRNTHEAADKPTRRRIVFSTTYSGWRRPTQIWVNPAELLPVEMPELVQHVHGLENGLILGGTRVHDWFLDNDAIDRVNLTIEPVKFAEGIPIFSGQNESDPYAVFNSKGFSVTSEVELNDAGTRYIELIRG